MKFTHPYFIRAINRRKNIEYCNMNVKPLALIEFKKYVSFLFNHAERVEELKELYFQEIIKADIPMLKFFKLFDDEELKKLTGQSLINFLNQVIEGTVVEGAIQNIKNWKEGKLPGIPKEKVEINDIVRVYSIRKLVCLHFFSFYSSDFSTYATVTEELEHLHNMIVEYAFQTYLEIHQEKLFQEKEFTSSILNNSVSAILAFDRDLRITEWNSVFERWHSLEREEVIGKKMFELFPQYEHREEGKAMMAVFEGEHVFIPERPLEVINGYYEANIVPLYDKNNVIIGGVSIIQETTHRREAGENLQAAYDQLQRQQLELISTNNILQKNQEALTITNQQLVEKQETLDHQSNTLRETVLELQKSRQHIINARDYYLQILEDFPALIWRAGIDGSFNYFNKSWLKFTGRHQEQECGKGWLEGIHPDDKEKYFDTYYEAFKEQKPFVVDYRLKNNEGNYRYLASFGKPMLGLENEFIGYIGTCFDIQDRIDAEHLIREKNDELISALNALTYAEEKLKQTNVELEKRVAARTRKLAASEEKLRQALDQMIQLNDELAGRENFLNSIIDQSPVSTCILDEKGTQIRVNKACLDLFGVPDASLGIGKYNILKDDTLKGGPFFKDIEAVFTKGEIAHFETDYDLSQVKHIAIPMGKKISLIATIFPIKDARGKIAGAVVKHEDITEKKHAESALRKSEEQLRLITDAIPVLISYVDKEKKYQFVSMEYERWFNLNRSDFLGKKVVDILGEKAYKNILPYFNRALNGEQVHIDTQQDYKNGSRYINANFIPNIVNDEVEGIYTLIYDISERKKTEQMMEKLYDEARKRNKELNRINTDLDNFIYTASHDLKSPVANLEGLLNHMQRIMKQKAEEQEVLLLDMMQFSINKLKKTIQDLVEITKVQKEIDQEKEKISFQQITEDIKSNILPLIKESGATIIENFKVKEIEYGKSHLQSIIYNLLSNAIKYRDPIRRTIVKISTSAPNGRVKLSVEDNGLGMTELQQKKLFIMFRRLHTHVEGTGIGLYTIKRIIENNGGSITVSSKAGEFSRFDVLF